VRNVLSRSEGADGLVLERSAGHERVRVEAWGRDGLRVWVAQDRILDDLPTALIDPGPAPEDDEIDVQADSLVNGKLGVRVLPSGPLVFFRTRDREELLAEQAAHFWWPGSRLFIGSGDGYYRLEQRFCAYEGEKLFGLGQHLHGRFDQKGLVVELVQRNAEVSIPFLVSSRGYGFLWNSPAVGRVELAENGTRWVADSARQIDYWVTTGEAPADIVSNYADATGHAPEIAVVGNWLLAVQAALPHAGRTNGSGTGVPSARHPAISDRGRLLPLAPPWRLALRTKRVA
jgi:alpha-D-xyloside xylohydrolase